MDIIWWLLCVWDRVSSYQSVCGESQESQKYTRLVLKICIDFFIQYVTQQWPIHSPNECCRLPLFKLDSLLLEIQYTRPWRQGCYSHSLALFLAVSFIRWCIQSIQMHIQIQIKLIQTRVQWKVLWLMCGCHCTSI